MSRAKNRKVLLSAIVASFITMAVTNFFYHGYDLSKDIYMGTGGMKDEAMKLFLQGTYQAKTKAPESHSQQKQTTSQHKTEKKEKSNNNEKIRQGSLSCSAYGGPSDEFATSEMVYWSDIPSDSEYKSPFLLQHEQHHRPLYMSFEPDGGGWNNIRMSIETFIVLAIAMGRTLVLPPQKKMYLLAKDRGHNRTKQQKHFTVADFFPISEAAQANAALNIMTMKEFLETEAMQGNLIDKETKQPSFPPHNRTDWEGVDNKEYDELRFWLRTVSFIPYDWKPGQCLAAFPASGNHKDIELLQTMQNQIHQEGKLDEKTFLGNPVAVNGSVWDRLKENLARRRGLCVYNETMQQELDIHFICSHKDRVRMLVHFYAFLFMEDWKEDLWMKRFVRDHLRYIDEIQCAAARIVHAMRQLAKRNDITGSNPHGEYDSFHIRRGDFQFKKAHISVEEIFENTVEELRSVANPNDNNSSSSRRNNNTSSTPLQKNTIYIATDERHKEYFEPLKKHYHIYFMDNFVHTHLQGVNTNFYGMIDQLVASRGRLFFGCWWSTFTGYITRLRGYRSQYDKQIGYEKGILPHTYYYVTKTRKFEMHSYTPVQSGFFHREYPTSWRLLDAGI